MKERIMNEENKSMITSIQNQIRKAEMDEVRKKVAPLLKDINAHQRGIREKVAEIVGIYEDAGLDPSELNSLGLG
jgi:DNA repair ATPase RecN